MKLFLEDHKKVDLLAFLNSEEFELSLTYLVDIFEARNKLNRQYKAKTAILSALRCHSSFYPQFALMEASNLGSKYRILPTP